MYGGRTEDAAGKSEVGKVQLGDAEVGDFCAAFGGDENVGGLDIAVYDSLSMSVVERVGNFCGELQGPLQRKFFLARENSVQRFAVDELQDEIGIVIFQIFADIVDGDDARMLQASGGLRFAEKSFAEFLFFFWFMAAKQDGLDRDQAVDLRIARLIDDAHGAAAQFPEDLVASEFPLNLILHTENARRGLAEQKSASVMLSLPGPR